jgi:hypothetical protein
MTTAMRATAPPAVADGRFNRRRVIAGIIASTVAPLALPALPHGETAPPTEARPQKGASTWAPTVIDADLMKLIDDFGAASADYDRLCDIFQVYEERWFQRRRKREHQILAGLRRRPEDIGLPIDAKADHYGRAPAIDGSSLIDVLRDETWIVSEDTDDGVLSHRLTPSPAERSRNHCGVRHVDCLLRTKAGGISGGRARRRRGASKTDGPSQTHRGNISAFGGWACCQSSDCPRLRIE